MTALPGTPLPGALDLPVLTHDAAPPAVLGASGIAGLAAAVAVPVDRPGVGWAGPDAWPQFNVGRSAVRRLLNDNDTYLRPCH